MLIIRLQRIGRKNQPLFRIVLTEKTAPIKGRYIESLGFFNPLKKEHNLKSPRIKYWLSKGAKPSNTVYNLLVKGKILQGPKRKIKIRKKKKEKRIEERPEKKPEEKLKKEPEQKPLEKKQEKKQEKKEKK